MLGAAGILLALAAIVAVYVLSIRRPKRPPLPVRRLGYRPIPFDPDRAPTRIRVLRPFRSTRKVECVSTFRKMCIQDLDLESYVRGVVAAEEGVFLSHLRTKGRMDRRRLAAAARAWRLQAIAARTYALYSIVADKYYSRKTGFHITSTPNDQTYTEKRIDEVDRAVEPTRGQVLVLDSEGDARLIHAEYSASCGGRGTYDVVKRSRWIHCHPLCAAFSYRRSTHRRGMCQWGSFLFALSGKSLSWLLQHYYPAARLMRLHMR